MHYVQPWAPLVLCSTCITRHHTAVPCCTVCHPHHAPPCSAMRCSCSVLPCSAVHCLHRTPLCVGHPLCHVLPCVRQCLHHALPAPSTACTTVWYFHCMLPAPSIACSHGLCPAPRTPLQCHELPLPHLQRLDPRPCLPAAVELQAAVGLHPKGAMQLSTGRCSGAGGRREQCTAACRRLRDACKFGRRDEGVFGDGLNWDCSVR